MHVFDQEKVRALFALAEIEVLNLWELPNGYWPICTPYDWDDANQLYEFNKYAQLRSASPWFLVKTKAGLVKVGWRKRVLSIDWSDTPVRAIITDDNVTKNESLVHAWTTAKAVEYLQALAKLLDQYRFTTTRHISQPVQTEEPPCTTNT